MVPPHLVERTRHNCCSPAKALDGNFLPVLVNMFTPCNVLSTCHVGQQQVGSQVAPQQAGSQVTPILRGNKTTTSGVR